MNARKRRFLIKSEATGVNWITTGTRKYKTDFTDDFVKELHEWVKGHRDVIACPNGKDTLKIKMEGQKDPVLMEKLLIQISIRELHNDLVKPMSEGGFAGARDKEGNIIIGDTTLKRLLPPQLRKMTKRNKILCGCETYLQA